MTRNILTFTRAFLFAAFIGEQGGVALVHAIITIPLLAGMIAG